MSVFSSAVMVERSLTPVDIAGQFSIMRANDVEINHHILEEVELSTEQQATARTSGFAFDHHIVILTIGGKGIIIIEAEISVTSVDLSIQAFSAGAVTGVKTDSGSYRIVGCCQGLDVFIVLFVQLIEDLLCPVRFL